MAAKVFFISAQSEESVVQIREKIDALWQTANFDRCFEAEDMVAIKIHFGEKRNVTHIPAQFWKSTIARLNQKGCKPFFTDTCVLYRSQRSDAVNHLRLAEKHGFSLAETGAPVIIADGLRGRNEIEVKIDGEIFSAVAIATEAVVANGMIVATHVTGHMAAGIGGAVKNLGMGLASRKGKLRQHSSVKPWVDAPKCTGCGQCILWCPENAISMNGAVAVISEKICIGCGECLTVCHFGAVQYNWKTSNDELQKKMAEHALGAIANKRDKICFINVVMNVTKDCDCLGTKQQPVISDIGILASFDPVAIDKASLDLIEQIAGKSLTQLSYPSLNPMVQLEHGAKVGLGKLEYEIVKINEPRR
ncbi:MAG: DUF362 domain-containing protein [Calditrichaeota bacterium]|nr:DUF362 domain-containing protein [Calditrichota bacterium]